MTFSFLLHRSLEWSPLRRERKARLLSFHRAGKATCPLRAGATMSTRPPMVSPAPGSVLQQPLGSCPSGGAPLSSTSWALELSFELSLRGCQDIFPSPRAGWQELEPGWGSLSFKVGVIFVTWHLCGTQPHGLGPYFPSWDLVRICSPQLV